MKYLISLMLCLIPAFTQAGPGGKIVIIHTNDMHSRLTGFAPESAYSPLSVNNDRTIGGFARLASIISAERAEAPESTIIIDAGDFLMGTFFHTLEPETGFQLPLMKKMGYDIVALGNHEFDFGTPVLAKIIRASASQGKIPQLILGNAVTSSTDANDDDFEALYRDELLKHTTVMERAGMKIGFFSLLGKDAADVAPKAKPITFEKQVKYARKAVAELKAARCDLIICVSHSGLRKEEDGTWSGEDADLAGKVPGIGVIISAHTHSLLDKPLIVNGVPIVQAGEYGMYAGKLVLDVREGKVMVESYNLIPVDDRIMGDEEISAIIDSQKKLLDEKILSPSGFSYSEPVAETQVVFMPFIDNKPEDGNLGPLVADAIHFYINSHSPEGTDLSMISAGVIRDAMMPVIQTAPDIFRIVPLGSGRDNIPGYALSRIYITGREMKNILEVLISAGKSNMDYYCFYSGIRVEYDPEKGFLKKIKSIELIKSGSKKEPVVLAKKNKTLYSVSANSYMLEFMSVIRKKSFGLINVVPKNSDGGKVTDMATAVIDMNPGVSGIQEGKEWLALIEYLKQMKDSNGNGIPDIDDKYHKPVKSLFTLKK